MNVSVPSPGTPHSHEALKVRAAQPEPMVLSSSPYPGGRLQAGGPFSKLLISHVPSGPAPSAP